MASSSGDSDGPPPDKNRTDLSPFEASLVEFWQAGMNNCKTDEAKMHITAAMTRTGLPEKTIKIWINNRNRGERQAQKAAAGADSSTETSGNPLGRQPTGYDLFKKDIMKGKKGASVVGNAGHAWSRLKEEEPQKYQMYMDQAKAIKLPSLEEASADVKRKSILKLWRQIEDTTNKLRELGCEALMMVSDGTREGVWEVNTPIAKQFFHSLSDNLQLDFHTAVRAHKPESSIPTHITKSTKEVTEEVRQELRQALNEITKATPGLPSRFPYQQVKDKNVSVRGLPAGLEVINLKDMGAPKLRTILEHKDKITLHVAGPSSASSVGETGSSGGSAGDEVSMETDGSGVEETSILEAVSNAANGPNQVAPPDDSAEVTLSHTKARRTRTAQERFENLAESSDLTEELYDVECFLKKKKSKGKVHYLVKWEGYTKPSWEPLHELEKCMGRKNLRSLAKGIEYEAEV